MDVEFKEVARENPHYVGWFNRVTDYIDTYFKTDGRWLFLRGIAECAPDYEKGEIDRLKQQLIANDCKFLRYYCHAPIDEPSPLDMVGWVKSNGLRWECFARFEYLKNMKQWQFGGNCIEYSAAFTFRIYDRALAIKTKRAFLESLDPTFAQRRKDYRERLSS